MVCATVSICGLILVLLEPAPSLSLTEIPIWKIVLKSTSRWFGLLKEMYETGKDFHCQVYIGMHLLGERNQGCGSNRWGKNHQWLGIRHLWDGRPSSISPLLTALINNPCCWIVLTADSSSPPHFGADILSITDLFSSDYLTARIQLLSFPLLT